jgi:hypothetical protein
MPAGVPPDEKGRNTDIENEIPLPKSQPKAERANACKAFEVTELTND